MKHNASSKEHCQHHPAPAAHGTEGHDHDEHPGHTCEHHGHGQHDHAVKPSGAAKYFCPMCPGVESDKPGDCPKCGMALERNPAFAETARTLWTCPMHPEV